MGFLQVSLSLEARAHLHRHLQSLCVQAESSSCWYKNREGMLLNVVKVVIFLSFGLSGTSHRGATLKVKKPQNPTAGALCIVCANKLFSKTFFKSPLEVRDLDREQGCQGREELVLPLGLGRLLHLGTGW